MTSFYKVFLLAVALLSVGLSGCSEKEEPAPEEEFPGYVSMLVENSGWSTVAYDDQIFSGMSGASFTYVKGSFDYDMQNTYEDF
jgi:hypothetical protein